MHNLTKPCDACLQAERQNAPEEALQGAALMDCKKRGEHYHFRLHSLHLQSARVYACCPTNGTLSLCVCGHLPLPAELC